MSRTSIRMPTSARMLTRNTLSAGLYAAFVFSVSAPAFAADIIQEGGWVVAPEISRELLKRDLVVERFRIEVDCGGIAGLDLLPDGWTTSVESRGETTIAIVSRPQLIGSPMSVEDAKSQALYFDRFRFRLLSRGEWSDCMSARFSVDTRPRQRFVGVAGPVMEGGRLRYRSEGSFQRWIPMDTAVELP